MLKDKVMLITGSSRGIGRATAMLAAKNHAKVIINYKNREKDAEELVNIINNDGFNAIMVKADVSKGNEVNELFKVIKDTYGRLDILINNAGIMKNNLLLMTKPVELDELININCRGPYLCMQQAARIMIRQKEGKIINMSSIVGLYGNKGQTAYSASKSFVIGLTKSAAKELGYYGITVNAIAPGFIETDLTKDVEVKVKQELKQNIPLGKFGTPKDVANAVLFLCSDLGNYISGQVIGVDGSEII